MGVHYSSSMASQTRCVPLVRLPLHSFPRHITCPRFSTFFGFCFLFCFSDFWSLHVALRPRTSALAGRSDKRRAPASSCLAPPCRDGRGSVLAWHGRRTRGRANKSESSHVTSRALQSTRFFFPSPLGCSFLFILLPCCRRRRRRRFFVSFPIFFFFFKWGGVGGSLLPSLVPSARMRQLLWHCQKLLPLG